MTIINPLLGSNFVTGQVFDPTLIGNSVWLDGSADFLKRDNFALSADGRKEFIFSMWIQRNEFGRAQTHFDLYPTGATSYNDGSRFTFPADDQLSFSVGAGGSSGGQKVSSAVYRDIGWYHVLISYNTNTSVTAASRHRLFVNGLEITDTSTYTAPPDNQSCIGSGTGNADLRIGKTEHPGIPYVPDAYFAQACYLEGKSFQAGDYAITDFLDSFTFGTNGSQYVPKADADIAALASTVGGNSFCLDFADSGGTDAANLGNDISSNNNDLTPTSMAAANQSSNTPSNVTATLNPLIPNASIAYSEGNTKITHTAFTQVVPATIFATSGKFYAEVLIEKTGTWAGYNGVVPADDQAGPNWVYPTGDGFIWVSNGTLNHVSAYPSVTTTYTNGDRLMFGLDVDNGWLFIGKNDTWYDASGNSFTDLTDSSNAVATTLLTVSTAGWTFAPGASHVSGTTTEQIFLEESSWAYTAPTNFVSLSSANLTAPTYQGIDYFTSTLYEGNGTGQRVGDFVPFTDAFNVANSAMFQHDEVRALSRTAGAPSSSGGKKGTWSVWYKTANIDTDNIFFDNGTTATNRFSLQMDASGQIVFIFAGTTILMTNADLKGGGLWRNLVLKVDTSLATASARAIMYIDGVEVTSFATDARASLTQDGELGYMDSGATQFVGSYNGVTANQWDGYFAETIFLDNQFLSADSFGQLDTSTNKWVPKDISGLTLGDQGFYLAYGGTFGTGNGAGDSTGNSNNLTEIGTWTGGDKFVDTPSANYATIDPVISNGSTPVTVSQGNLQGVRSASGFQQAYSNFSGFRLQENTGIYFAEVLVGSDTSNFNVGVLSGDPPSSTNRYLGQDSNTYGYDLDGRKVNNGAYATYGASYTAGDVIGIEIDTDTGAINFHKNGADQGQAFTAIVGPYNFAFASESGGGPGTFNFGQQMELGGASTTLNAAAGGRFKHTPPTGAKALNQDNLDDTASKITAWAWIKNRDATDSHVLVDRVRGVGEVLHSNEAAAEATEPNTVQRFLQRGVQVGSDVQVNTANESYVLWQWLAGDSATTGTVIPADNPPSIASTVITADAGHFSVGTYTGQTAAGTVGHGLGGIAEMVIVWDKGADNSIAVYHYGVASDAATDYLLLNQTDAATDNATFWNDTAPTASVFSVGTGNNTNGDTRPKSFLAFRSVPGVCKVGSFVGNANANGPYIDLGFKPAFFMAKQSSAVENWVMLDNQRPNYNPTGGYLFANLNNAEGGLGSEYVDFLSSGVKLRTTGASVNGSATFIYLAMADIGGNGTLPPVYGR